MHSEILKPVVVLAAWTLVMLLWLIAARMPAVRRAGLDVSKMTGGRPHGLEGIVPDRANWPAHNYMHLMEQPTLFYAVALVIALTGTGDGINALLAWAYVGLRVLHSIVQATFNRIAVRFVLFGLSTLALVALTLHAAMAVF